MAQAISNDDARDKVRELLGRIGTVMLVTADGKGGMHARPMEVMRVEEGTVWFFTELPTPKTTEIYQDHDVLLTASDPDRAKFVSVSGRGRIVQDLAKQEELWTEAAAIWHPEGPRSPGVALLAVQMEGAEYWDSPGSSAVLVAAHTKGDNARVSFGRA